MGLDILPGDFLSSRERRLMGQVPRGEHLAVRRPVERVPFTRADGGVPGPSEVYATRLRPMTYDLHMGGNMVNTAADTHREGLPSILIYGDSFTNAVECVAYLSFGEMCSLYLCYYHEMSLEDYIRAVRPDIVVCIRDYEAMLLQTGNGGAGESAGRAEVQTGKI